MVSAGAFGLGLGLGQLHFVDVRRGEYKLETQRKGWGYYAHVVVELSPGEESLQLDLPDGLSFDERLSVAFGVTYAARKCALGGAVRVVYVHTMMIDTTPIALAYAAAHAVYEAAGNTDLERPSLDADTGRFVFPK